MLDNKLIVFGCVVVVLLIVGVFMMYNKKTSSATPAPATPAPASAATLKSIFKTALNEVQQQNSESLNLQRQKAFNLFCEKFTDGLTFYNKDTDKLMEIATVSSRAFGAPNEAQAVASALVKKCNVDFDCRDNNKPSRMFIVKIQEDTRKYSGLRRTVYGPDLEGPRYALLNIRPDGSLTLFGSSKQEDEVNTSKPITCLNNKEFDKYQLNVYPQDKEDGAYLLQVLNDGGISFKLVIGGKEWVSGVSRDAAFVVKLNEIKDVITNIMKDMEFVSKGQEDAYISCASDISSLMKNKPLPSEIQNAIDARFQNQFIVTKDANGNEVSKLVKVDTTLSFDKPWLFEELRLHAKNCVVGRWNRDLIFKLAEKDFCSNNPKDQLCIKEKFYFAANPLDQASKLF